MAKQIKLPQWGMSMSEGTVTEWLVSPGDRVTVGQPLVEVESAKAVEVVESSYDGTMGAILVQVDETVPVNTVLGTILEPGESPAAGDPGVAATWPAAEEAAGTAAAPRTPASGRPGAEEVQAVPLARRRAKEEGIDLAVVTGTGPRGRITVADVEAAIAARSPASGAAGSPGMPGRPAAAVDKRTKMSRIRTVIGQRMLESLRTTAQLTLVTTADVTRLGELRSAWQGPDRPTYTDAVIRACALALRGHPGINTRIDGEDVIEFARVAIGVAVAVESGLVVPVVRDPDELSLAEVARATAELTSRARQGDLAPDDFAGATFSVTSLGGQGIDAFTPVLNPPEAAILGIGRAKDVPVRDGQGIAWRSQLSLSLTIDHRLVDGYPGALFLADVVKLLEDPGTL